MEETEPSSYSKGSGPDHDSAAPTGGSLERLAATAPSEDEALRVKGPSVYSFVEADENSKPGVMSQEIPLSRHLQLD
ncbi:hypothetical protein WOLCODRAFT_153752 [Wolfiporia cocos MD-104 SS10]|uniref:Uncharacterized protein n=1 Tax=Wolfiporia cocos (strain MD-104) TaxID=742152 RepID=A0A2H3JNE6_WOLCO|nr:hypothetical protein WOLCODRAFT_153752 [Wolfiporia cocos MD-104 SS10]